jgi:hypothetical protein
MARQVKNILVGVGYLELSGELDANGVPATPLADMGYTIDGVEITLEPDMVDIVVDQLGDAAKIIEQSIKVMIKSTLAEATLANLAIAWGRPDAAYTANGVGGTLNLGVNPTGKPAERMLRFVGKSPEGYDRTYTCNRAISASSSGHSYKRGEATVFPVDFRILPDGASTGAEYGTIVDAVS